MADPVSVEELAETMFKLVERDYGQKKYKPMDLTKQMIEQFDGEVDKRMCKKALRSVIDSGRLTYKYAGGSYVTRPEDS